MLNNYQILSELFLNIQNSKSKFYQSKSSKDFEDVMQRLLDSLNFVKLSNDKEYKLQHIYNKELMFDEKITYEQVEQKWKL
ncbi:Uncharacterised protein [Mycoplasmopsis citelli]|uniref:Uncharacterized protein n=1 Tax=Mycoplasmopsis citelli TaxID=171281 RepID=A0A449B0U2_9BACT|nr:hypothetical protein [Mycoplasmopsis citelli]VEU74173.1 Uncharacterised protein [Mycoplasmopsis citelli]